MKYFSLLILLALSSQANAADYQIEFGIHGGGDEVANVTFVSGNTKTIEGGGLFSLSAGLVFDHDSYTSRFKLGIKKDSIDATNGSLNWDRITADVLLMYKLNEDVQIGAGLTYHSSIELSGSGVVAGSAKFDNALGFMMEADYFWDTKSYIGLSLTAIDYKISGSTFSGNSLGVVIGGIF